MGDAVVIGVDGGGTRSAARVWERGRVVASAAGGAVNPNRVGVAGGRAALTRLLVDVVVGISHGDGEVSVDAACVGLSGVSHPASRDIVHAAFETAGVRVGTTRILVSDAECAFEAAFRDDAQGGVLVISGTGSIAVCRDAKGTLRRAGGVLPGGDDPGGGAWIARAAGAVDAAEVFRRADVGDPVALAVVARAAEALAALAAEAARGASLPGTFAVRVAGGVFAGAPRLRTAFAEALRTIAPCAQVALGAVPDPLDGCFLFARRGAGRSGAVPPGW